MIFFSFNRLKNSLQTALSGGVSYLQHVSMKAAVAASLKLCLFTVRVLLHSSSSSREQTSQSF